MLRTLFQVGRRLIIENEPAEDETEKEGEPLYPYNAYSPSAQVTASYVYAGHGRTKDFEALKKMGRSSFLNFSLYRIRTKTRFVFSTIFNIMNSAPLW